jgi:hypothetical protein
LPPGRHSGGFQGAGLIEQAGEALETSLMENTIRAASGLILLLSCRVIPRGGLIRFTCNNEFMKS